MQAALQWAQQSGEPEIGLRIATALWRFWSRRGEYTEGRTRVEALTSEPGLKSEFFYTVNATLARRWLEARAQG